MARILLADDEAAVRDMVAFKLRQLGHEPILAQDGLQALALCARERPDLIILDVMMPGLNGMEVLCRLKADPASTPAPVLMLSAWGRERDVTRALSRGAAEYVVKPFSLTDLGARVESTLCGTYGPARAAGGAPADPEPARPETAGRAQDEADSADISKL